VGRSGRTRASRGETRILSLQAAQLIPWRARGEHVAWEDPRREACLPVYEDNSCDHGPAKRECSYALSKESRSRMKTFEF